MLFVQFFVKYLTYFPFQIARAAVVFNINEIIIFDENGNGDR